MVASKAGLIVIWIFLLIIGLIVAAAFMIYKAAYKRKINRRLTEGREADIKPMMSPVKFVIITLISIIAGIIALWILVLFAAGAYRGFRKSDDGLETRILAYEMLDNSPFSGYKTGDEIKGYTDYVTENEDSTLRLHVYVANNEYKKIFPPVLVAAEYLGDKQVQCAEFDEEYNEGRASRNYKSYSEENGSINDNAVLYIYTNKSHYTGDAVIKYKVWFGEETDECDASVQTRFTIDTNGDVGF